MSDHNKDRDTSNNKNFDNLWECPSCEMDTKIPHKTCPNCGTPLLLLARVKIEAQKMQATDSLEEMRALYRVIK